MSGGCPYCVVVDMIRKDYIHGEKDIENIRTSFSVLPLGNLSDLNERI